MSNLGKSSYSYVNNCNIRVAVIQLMNTGRDAPFIYLRNWHLSPTLPVWQTHVAFPVASGIQVELWRHGSAIKHWSPEKCGTQLSPYMSWTESCLNMNTVCADMGIDRYRYRHRYRCRHRYMHGHRHRNRYRYRYRYRYSYRYRYRWGRFILWILILVKWHVLFIWPTVMSEVLTIDLQ